MGLEAVSRIGACTDYNDRPCLKACAVSTILALGISSPAAVIGGRNSWTLCVAAIIFLDILEQVRAKYGFVVAGYVVMPEHFHLLISEPHVGKLSGVMQVLKQRVSRRCRARKKRRASQMELWDNPGLPSFWQTRYYDFNVFRQRKYTEKLRYIHRNPVKRGLVASPELWRWSSFRDYQLGEQGKVKIGN